MFPNSRLVVYDLQKVSKIRLKACKSCVLVSGIPAVGHRRTDRSFSGHSFWPRWNPGNSRPQKSNSRLESSWYLEIVFLFKHLKTNTLIHLTVKQSMALLSIVQSVCLSVCLKLNCIIRADFINWWLERGLGRGLCIIHYNLSRCISHGRT